MQKLMVGTLSILITGNCNLKCAHCLRGEAFNKEIDDKTIENTFANLDEIGLLIITGGEPFFSDKSLNKIEKIVTEIEKNNVRVNQIQLVTNGTIYNEKVEEVLKKLYSLAYNKEASVIIVSDDEYHDAEVKRLGFEDLRDENTEKLERLSCKLGVDFRLHTVDYILDMGRATKLDKTKKEHKISYYEAARNVSRNDLCLNELHVSLDGRVLPHGSLSHDLIDEYTILNINETNDLIGDLADYSDLNVDKLDGLAKIMSRLERPTREKLKNIFRW